LAGTAFPAALRPEYDNWKDSHTDPATRISIATGVTKVLTMNSIATVAFILLLAGALYAIRIFLLGKRRPLEAFSLRLFWGALTTASMATLVFWASNLLGSAAVIAVPVLLAAISIFEVADFASFQHFDDSILDILRCLPVQPNISSVSQLIRAYGAQYFPRGHFAAVLAVIVVPFIAMGLAGYLQSLLPTLACAGVITAALMRQYRPQPKMPRQLSSIEWALVESESKLSHFPLRRANRRKAVTLLDAPMVMPRTVLIIINESAGAHLPSSCEPGVSLARRLCELSGSPDAWFVPSNAISNSNCTDISIPSLLTGTGAHENADKLHRLPFVFDVAKARGYQTVFFTSSSLNWANLDAFFSGAAIDETFTADSSGAPLVNDMGIDDYIPAQKMALHIENAEGPLFAVLYLNALHVPFQANGICEIPATITARRNRAIFLTEKVHQLLFNALHSSGRYDNALIVSIGDHGELIGAADDVGVRAARLIQLGDFIVRPLFLLKPPKILPHPMNAALERNQNALIANIDIAPTIAHLLGARVAGELRYAGFSLFDDIPRSRVIYALNSNEWHFWHRSAAAVFRDKSSLVVDYKNDDLYRYKGSEPSAGDDRDDLFAHAFNSEPVRAAIAQIYQDKLGYNKTWFWKSLIGLGSKARIRTSPSE
jgi:hypothetical protein